MREIHKWNDQNFSTHAWHIMTELVLILQFVHKLTLRHRNWSYNGTDSNSKEFKQYISKFYIMNLALYHLVQCLKIMVISCCDYFYDTVPHTYVCFWCKNIIYTWCRRKHHKSSWDHYLVTVCAQVAKWELILSYYVTHVCWSSDHFIYGFLSLRALYQVLKLYDWCPVASLAA